MKIGAHVSTAGGLDKAVDRAMAIGAETIQIFGGAPQTWRRRAHSPESMLRFKAKCSEAGIGPVFIHAIYLINLATADPEHLHKSRQSLIDDMRLASQIGAAGVIFHLGSRRGASFGQVFDQVIAALKHVLAETPADTWLILENSAGMGDHLGSRFNEIGMLIKAVSDPRMKVCLDTQHCFAAGYDLSTADGLDAAMDEFQREIGLDLLVAVHANDSKVKFASGVDRHENIGQGHMGRDAFRLILSHPALSHQPFILEVPGFANEGPDRENIDILRSLAPVSA